MIVNYDRDSGKWTTFVDRFKKEPKEVSSAVNELFGKASENTKLSDLLKDHYDKDTFQDSDFNEWVEGLGEWVEGLGEQATEAITASDALEQYRTHIQDAANNTSVFSNMAKAAGGVLKSLGSAALNAGIEMAITFALQQAITLISDYIHKTENLIKAGEEAKSSIKESYSSYSDLQSSVMDLGKSYADSADEIETTGDAVDSIAKKYDELSKGVNSFTNENERLTTDQYDEYVDVCNQLAELFPSLVSGYDEQGNALLNLGNGAESATSKLQELLDTQKQIANFDISSQIGTAYEGTIAQDGEYDKQIRSIEASIQKGKDEQSELEGKLVDLSGLAYGQSIRGDSATISKVNSILRDAGIVNTSITNETLPTGLTESILTLNQSITEKQATDLENIINAELLKSSSKLAADIATKEQELATAKLQKEQALNSFSEYVGDFFQTNDVFTGLDESLKSSFINNLSNVINLDDAKEKYGEEGEDFVNYIYGEFVQPFSELTQEQQVDMSKLFDIDTSELTLNEYRKKIDKAFEDMFPDDAEMQEKLKKSFGFESAIRDMEDVNTRLMREFADRSKLSFDEVEKNIKGIQNLTGEDREIGYDLIVNDGFSGTFEEFLAAIAKAKKEAAQPINLEATPYLDAYERAKETENEGSNYEKIKSALSEAKELYDSGDIGTDDFKTASAIFSPTGANDPENFKENLAKAERYLTDDNSGVLNFLNDLKGKGFAEYNEETQEWAYSFNDLEQAARDMGMSFEWFMAMFGELSDKGFNNNFFGSIEEGKEHLASLYDELAEEEMKLAELERNDPGNKTAIDAQKEKIDALNQSIQDSIQYLNQLATMEAKDYDTQVTSAKEAIKALQEQKEKVLADGGENADSIAKMIEEDIAALADEYKISIDAEGNIVEDVQEDVDNSDPVKIDVEYESKGALDELLQEETPSANKTPEKFIDAYWQDNPQLGGYTINQTQVGADTSQVTQNTQEAVTEVEDTKADISVGADTAKGKADVDSYVAYIESLEADVSVGADTRNISSNIEEELDSKEYSVKVKAKVETTGDSSGQDTGNKSSTKTKTTKPRANGTFNTFANGTLDAFTSGTSNVSIPNDEVAFINEVGEEGLVRNGKLIPIRGGAQLINLRRGDIIFNHKQMAELKKNGHVTSNGGRGKLIGAHAQGTFLNAYAGSTAGGFGGKLYGSSSSATNENTSATSENTKETEKNTKATQKSTQTFDWVAIRLQYFSDKTKSIADTIHDYVTSVFKASQLKRQINAISNEIKTNNKGANTYLKKANKVAKKYTYYDDDGDKHSVSIPKKYKKLVQQGKWKIEDMDTSTDKKKALTEAIQSYQDYYDKAKDCKQAVVDLRNEQLELFEELANMPLEKAEKKVDKLSTSLSRLELEYSKIAGFDTKAMNKNLDAQTDNAKKEVAAYQTAYNQTNKRVTNTTTKLENAKNAFTDKQLDKLSAKQRKALENGTEINTTGLKGNLLKKANAYNQALAKNTIALNARDEALQDLTDSEQNYIDTLHENTKEKFDNIVNGYELYESWLEADRNIVDAKLEYRRASGQSRVSDEQKDLMIESIASKNLSIYNMENSLEAARKSFEENSANMTKEGLYDAENKLKELESNILNAKSEVADLWDEYRQIELEKLTDEMTILAASAETLQSEMDLAESLGKTVTNSQYESLVANSKKQQENLKAQNALLLEQQKNYEEGSEKYNELQEQINSNNQSILDAEKSQADWNKTIRDMPLEVFEKLAGYLSSIKSTYQSLLSLRETQGEDRTIDEVRKELADNSGLLQNERANYNTYKKNFNDVINGNQHGFDQLKSLWDRMQDASANNNMTLYDSLYSQFEKLQEHYDIPFDEALTYLQNMEESQGEIYSLLEENEKYLDEIFEIRTKQLEDEKDALQKLKDLSDRRLKLEEARYAVETAKEKKNLVYNGTEFVYQRDESEYKDALQSLNDVEFDELLNSIDDNIELLADLVKDFNLYDKDGNPLGNQETILQAAILAADKIVNGIIDQIKNAGYEVSGFSNGGVVTNKDSNILDAIAESKGEDHMVALKEGEIVLNERQVKNIEEQLGTSAEKYEPLDIRELFNGNISKEYLEKTPELLTLFDPSSVLYSNPYSNVPTYTNQTKQFNCTIGDIYVQEAQDADKLAEEIVMNLPRKMKTNLMKH